FSLLMVVSMVAHVALTPFYSGPLMILMLGVTFVVVTLPFLYSGLCVCLALTKFPRQVSTLYGADLAGAALGCVLLIGFLDVLDGVSAVFATALLACVGSACFLAKEHSRLKPVVLASCAVLAGLVLANTVLTRRQASPLQITWTKGFR